MFRRKADPVSVALEIHAAAMESILDAIEDMTLANEILEDEAADAELRRDSTLSLITENDRQVGLLRGLL